MDSFNLSISFWVSFAVSFKESLYNVQAPTAIPRMATIAVIVAPTGFEINSQRAVIVLWIWTSKISQLSA
jgi:hypothetical protein